MLLPGRGPWGVLTQVVVVGDGNPAGVVLACWKGVEEQ